MSARIRSYLDGPLRALRVTRPDADLSGQVALITGGSRGLGLLLARELANEGCKLALCARDELELVQAREILAASRRRAQQGGAPERVEASGTAPPDPLLVPCDVTDGLQVEQMVNRVLEHFGRIDILVNNAGIIQVTPLGSATRADFEAAMCTMFWGMYDVTMAVLPTMLERGCGRIVNVTSIGGKVSVPHLLPYSSAKFAATGFSEGLRAELAGKNVTVTTIVPGLMRTGSITNVLVKGNKQREVAWFSILASLPLVSMDARRAARQIVRALRRGQAEAIIGLPAKLAVRGQALFPNVAAGVLGQIGRMLPEAAAGEGMVPTLSSAVPDALDLPAVRHLTFLSRQAARRYNELPRNGNDGQQTQRA